MASMLSPTANRLEHYLDLLGARQKVVASNIANADTPGYKTQDIDFRSEFQRVMDGDAPKATEVSGLAVRNDGNNVSVDREARLLSENGLRFGMASTLLRSEIRLIKSAIQEGRNG